MTEPTLLVVDDETDNLDALERIFRKRFHLLRANSGHEALAILAETERVDVIITDQRMPKMTGVEFLEKTLVTHPRTVRILLTGYTDIDSIIAAVNQGHIFRYITKPWDPNDLQNSVERAMEHYSRALQLDIKNQELEFALNELKLLDQAKNKFMILINHELKTPLTVLNSFLSLLQETRLDDDQTMYLNRIKKSALRLQEVIDDTLILTRHAAGLLKPSLKSAKVSELINSSIDTFKADAQKKSLEISFDTEDTNFPAIHLDSQLIKKAIEHLLANAIRFSPPNSQINIRQNLIDGTCSIIFENEGSPIPESVLTKLQTPFNLQSEIMNHSKGMGLGLSVANAVIESHGGKLLIVNQTSKNQSQLVRATLLIPT
jgi:signal transduction histidine kinase